VDIDFEAKIAFGVTVIVGARRSTELCIHATLQGSIVPPSFDDFKIVASTYNRLHRIGVLLKQR
jgi:hypothetical protein